MCVYVVVDVVVWIVVKRSNTQFEWRAARRTERERHARALSARTVGIGHQRHRGGGPARFFHLEFYSIVRLESFLISW